MFTSFPPFLRSYLEKSGSRNINYFPIFESSPAEFWVKGVTLMNNIKRHLILVICYVVAAIGIVIVLANFMK